MSYFGEDSNITGNLNIGTLQLIGGAITDSSGSISFGSNNVSTTGNVGIGTNNPLEKLDVNGGFLRVRDATSTTIGNSIFRSDSLELGMNRSADGLSYIDFHGSVGSDYDFRCIRGSGTNEAIQFINAGTGNMVFATNSTNAMIIDGTGNVGIGITTPLTKLEISGDASEYIKVYNQGTAGDRAGLIMCNDSANNLAGGDTPQWGGFIDWKVGNDDLFIGHYRNYVRNEYITLDSSGNVGIGTDNPARQLHVYRYTNYPSMVIEGIDTQIIIGADCIQNTGYIQAYYPPTDTETDLSLNPNGGNVGIGINNPTNNLHISGSGSSTVLMLENTETGANKWGFHSMGSVRTGRLEIQSQGGTDTIPFTIEKSCPSHTLYLDSSGNVSIGTSSSHSSLSKGLSLGASEFDPKSWSTICYKDGSNAYPPSLSLGQTIYSGIINSAGGALYFYARNNTASYYYAISNSGTLFTGQHSGTGNPTLLKAGENEGLIVECDGTYVDKIEINNSWVNVKLTSTNKSPRVYGVISTHSAEEELSDENNVYKDHEQDNWGNDIHDNQIRVNSLGEGAIWVSNLNGNFLNGDFIVSTTIKGYGGKQDDDILHNYTIGKVLSDCDFTNNNYKKRYLTSEGIQITENEYDENIHYIACFIGCVYYCG